MEPSLHIGQVFGTRIRLHFSCVLMVTFALNDAMPLTPTRAVNALVLLIVLFACILLHELGHALVARWCGISTPVITLWGMGGLAHLERTPDRPLHDLLIALAGPTVTFALALASGIGAIVAYIFAAAIGVPPDMEFASLYDHLTLVNTLTYIVAVNLILLVFNLLPALPLDGGRALRALLAMIMQIGRVNAVMTVLTRIIAVIVLALGIVLVDIALAAFAIIMFVFASVPVTYHPRRRQG